MMNCCGEPEKKEAPRDGKKTDDTDAGKRVGDSGHGSHARHGGCGMHGGGFMKWLWIGLLVFLVVSYLR
jgi:hypothetical protein